MWISKKEYERLKTGAEFWEKEYDTINERKLTAIKALGDCLKDAQTTIDNLKSQVESLKSAQEELQKYKQKYADEVQKRLELVKLLENTP
jgi:outer membrane protein TolC